MKFLKLLGTAAIVLAFAFGLLGIYGLVFNPIYQVEVTQDTAQAKLNEKLPFSPEPKGGVQITIHEGATVAFLPDGKVGVAGTFTAKPTLAKESHVDGTVQATGKLVFEKRAFYVKELAFDELTYEMVLSARAKAATKAARGIAERLGARVGLNNDDVRALLDPDKMKASVLGYVTRKLNDTPVYKLNGTKWWHWVANASIDKLEVRDKALLVTLSLNKFLLHVMWMCAVVAMALLLTLGLFMSGGVGVFAALTFGALG